MFYFVMACITMFVASTISFIAHNTSPRKDYEELAAMLGASLTAAILWFIAIPAGIILGGAWLIAKLFSRDRKSKK
jgi:ABC-type nitrate/sulfonate/bicarbonate transport system permease component